MSHAASLACALAIFMGAVWGSPASAYQCTRTDDTGPSVAWRTRQVNFVLGQKNGEEVNLANMELALRHAVEQWNAVGCSDFTMTVLGSTGDLRGGFDWRAGEGEEPNTNLVVFRGDDETELVDSWLHDPTAIAITTATFVRQSGRIVDADIELNDRAFVFSACDPDEPGCLVRNDLKNTLTHEVGHAFGLDHTLDNEPGGVDATMYRRAPEGDLVKRDLNENDVAGICFLYPSGGITGECFGVVPEDPPPITITSSCAQTGGTQRGFALWLLLGAAACLRFRRRPTSSVATRTDALRQ